MFRIFAVFLCAVALFCDEIPFGFPGGPKIKNVNEVVSELKKDNYQLEILISFANHTAGSAGHLALSVRQPDTDEEIVHSANFYADRQHEDGKHYVDEVVATIEKKEYVFGVNSSLENSSFGLDFGEIFKRSLIGIRIYGITREQIEGIEAFYRRVNEDYRNRVSDTDYQYGEIKYDYMNLNCAKTVAQALHFGAGFTEIPIRGNHFLGSIPKIKALYAHVPTKTALDIMEVMNERGLLMDVILYKRYEHSEYMNDHPEAMFKDLVNRFPSVKSLDYFSGSTKYEDYDNLYAMNLFYQLGKYSLAVPQSGELLIEKSKEPDVFVKAHEIAKEQASDASKNVLRRLIRTMGIRIFPDNNTGHLYNFQTSEPVRIADELYSDGEQVEFLNVAP